MATASSNVSPLRRSIQTDLSGATGQQTLFAFVDTLAKALLTGLAEQSPPSVAKGKERYERFLKNAAATMLNGSHPLWRHGVDE